MNSHQENIFVERYLSLFKGREDHFAQQNDDGNGYSPISKTLDSFYLQQHFDGDATYGMYVLTSNSDCHFFCIDIDIPKSDLPNADFKKRSEKYSILKQQLNAVIKTITDNLHLPQEALLLEETGGRGYHIWFFLKEPISGKNMVLFGKILKNVLTFDFEFFPKQGQLTSKTKLGNLIKLPLGYHKKYRGKSIFFTISDNGPLFADEWEKNVEIILQIIPADLKVILTHIADIAADNTIPVIDTAECNDRHQRRPLYKGDIKKLFSNCSAIRNIKDKAQLGQKLSRQEAFHFTNILLSVKQGGTDFVINTMQESFGNEYNEYKTQSEIEKIGSLFPSSCATLVEQNICSDYCREGVREKNNDPLLTNTTPCSVWLSKIHNEEILESGDFVTMIGHKNNVQKAFFQLKYYHEYEDLLFFDSFDFEQFEKDLFANCEIIAACHRERIAPPLSGYLAVKIPKKLDAENHLVYRRMAYSTVFDQVPIQSVFNIIAPQLERTFQDSSYGYRWNINEHESHRIFVDWREAYPCFRNKILNVLRGTPNGVYICCDIKGYYDHIDHAIIVEQLRTIIKDEYILKYISNVIAMYSYDESEKKGLPQGPAYARILANLYLNDFDKFAATNTVTYLRYVDDLFLFFKSQEDAEHGLEQLVLYLGKLGLELSDADDKKPIITQNSDESRVRQSLDKIQYGILEETRQLKHLDHCVISDFSDAVERHKVSPETLDELVALNDYIPTLLYVVTTESLISHPLRNKVWNIVKYLIEHQLFFPKKLKSVFYRLLEISPSDQELIHLYEHMDPAHRVYFLLSVYGTCQKNGNHRQLLEIITEKAIHDHCEFLCGFGFAIGNRLGLDKLDICSVQFFKRIKNYQPYFVQGKMVSGISYLSLPEDVKEIVRLMVAPSGSSLLKVLLLANLTAEPQIYIDVKYLCNLINDNNQILLPAVCSAISRATNESDFFRRSIEVVCSCPTLKSSVISLLKDMVFNQSSCSGYAQIENKIALYGQISDPEIQRILVATLKRINGDIVVNDCGIEFLSAHLPIHKYNECLLLEPLGQPNDYDYIEMIPVSRLRQYIPYDINFLKETLEDLVSKKIIPPLKFIYYAQREEVCLQFRSTSKLCQVSKEDFALNATSILRVLRLAVQIYKKANYAYRALGVAPYINTQNLLVSQDEDVIVFRTLGKSLCCPYQIDGITIGNTEKDISKMVGIFLGSLLIGDRNATEVFMKKSHTGIESFLALFIKNMFSKSTDSGYSCSRFEYLVEQLTIAAKQGEQQIATLYMRERLKSDLFSKNSARVNWYGISGAVANQVYHLYNVCNNNAIKNVAFRNRIVWGRQYSQLHWVSQQILNITLNRGIGITHNIDRNYLDTIEQLLIFSAISIEIVTLSRGISISSSRRELELNHDYKIFHVIAAEYRHDYDLSEIIMANNKISDTTEYTLSQMLLQILLSFEVIIKGNYLYVQHNDTIPHTIFNLFAHACLIRVPQIEDNLKILISSVLDSLKNNEEMTFPVDKLHLHQDLMILSRDFEKFRKCFRIRRCSGHASGKEYFPPDIKCRGLFMRSITVKEHTLPATPLTSNLPTSNYYGSWDIKSGSIINLVLPNDILNKFFIDLRHGKFFGTKITYLYSGKVMFFYDLVIIVVLCTLLVMCEYGKTNGHELWNAFLAITSKIILGFTSALVIKLFWDITHWIPLMKTLIKRFSVINDTSEYGKH